VVSVLWLAFVAVVALADGTIPNMGRLESDFGSQTRKAERQWAHNTIDAARPASGISSATTTVQIRAGYENLSDAEVVERVHLRFPEADFGAVDLLHKVGLSAIKSEHQKKVDGLVLAQAKGVGALLLMWLVPSFGLYLLGWAMAWVWRGFKSKGESQ